MAFLNGKFARFRVAATAVTGAFRWQLGLRRERMDTTNFESVVSASGNNVHSDGLTGVLDSTVTIEGYSDDNTINLLFPEASLAVDLLYRKTVSLGYAISYADVLAFSPKTGVRDRAGFTCELQTNGLVSPAV
jgi:hypothetical protein